MTFDVKLGAKTTMGNVTRYEFSVTRNMGPTFVGPAPAGTPYTADYIVQKDIPKKSTKSDK